MSVIIKFILGGETSKMSFIPNQNGGDDEKDTMYISDTDWAYDHDGDTVTHPDGNEAAMEQIKEWEREL